MKWITVLYLLGLLACHARADCYPGHQQYNIILQSLFQSVTQDNMIVLSGPNQPVGSFGYLDRNDLCSILTDHHNSGSNSGQLHTNKDFLGGIPIGLTDCVTALSFPTGYTSATGLDQWTGYHTGQLFTSMGAEPNIEERLNPVIEISYTAQEIRFISRTGCVTQYTFGTCLNGWNQSVSIIAGVCP